LLSVAALLAQKHYTELVYPPLRELVVPEVERVELPNGLVLYLLEDRSLPKVEGMALVRTGSRFEPSDRVGLASVLGQAMRTGGSTHRPGEEVDRLLEDAGASVEIGIGEASGRASLFALKEQLPLVLEILAEILKSPALPQDKIDLALVQGRTAVSRRNDNVTAIASREFGKLLYGAESPYARTTEYATLRAITRDDLVSFHRRYFVPNGTFLGLWGDFEPSEVRTLVERLFGSWERGSASIELPGVPEADGGSVSFIQKDDVNQTSLRIGHLGGRVDDPDYFALSVMAEILGGGFSSRLFQAVRSQRGLAYGARASWSAAFDHPGSFVVSSATKSESTVEAIHTIVSEIERMTAEPVSEDELRQAKDGIQNSFVFNFDSKGEIVSRLMTYDYYGYPADFLKRYQESVARVEAADVLRVAKEHVKPGALHILAVGRSQDFDAPLSTLGEVRTLDITIPAPPRAESPEASADSLAAGERIIAGFVQSAGAAGKLERFSLQGESRIETPQGPMAAGVQIWFQAPDRYRETTVLPFGEVVTVLNGDEGWVSTPRGIQDLDADRRARTRQGIFRHYLGLLWAAANGRIEAQATGPGEALLKVEGLEMGARFDEATGRLLELSLPGTSFQGAPVEELRKFSEFDDASGLPHAVAILHDGSPAAETRFTRQTIDPEATDERFTRPQER
jgi:zinc protease